MRREGNEVDLAAQVGGAGGGGFAAHDPRRRSVAYWVVAAKVGWVAAVCVCD